MLVKFFSFDMWSQNNYRIHSFYRWNLNCEIGFKCLECNWCAFLKLLGAFFEVEFIFMFNLYLLNKQKKTTPSPPQSEEHKTRAKLLCLLFIFDSGLGNCLKKNNKKSLDLFFSRFRVCWELWNPSFTVRLLFTCYALVWNWVSNWNALRTGASVEVLWPK